VHQLCKCFNTKTLNYILSLIVCVNMQSCSITFTCDKCVVFQALKRSHLQSCKMAIAAITHINSAYPLITSFHPFCSQYEACNKLSFKSWNWKPKLRTAGKKEDGYYRPKRDYGTQIQIQFKTWTHLISPQLKWLLRKPWWHIIRPLPMKNFHSVSLHRKTGCQYIQGQIAFHPYA
jgi:hypothetical protein